MMIDKRLINTVPESKKWIAITVCWNWLALVGSVLSALGFAFLLQQAYFSYATPEHFSLSMAVAMFVLLLVALVIRAYAAKKAVNASYYASTQVKHHLRRLIYQKIASMPLNQVQAQSTASLIQVASEGVEQIEIYFGRYLPQLFYSLLAPLSLFAFLVFFNVPTAVILLLCVPLIPFSIIAVNKIAKRLLAKYWSIYVGLGSSFLDNLQGLVTLKIYQDDAYKAKVMDKEAEHFRNITMKVLTMQLNSVSIMDLLAYGGSAVGIITALYQFQAGAITIFGVLLFILLSSEFFIPLRLLGSFFHVAMNGKAASDKIFALLDTPVEDQTQGRNFSPKNGVTIAVKNVRFAYPAKDDGEPKQVLSDVNLTIKPQALTVIVGKSGCGKSTLVSLLMRFYHPTAGEILFNGENSQDFNRESFYRAVALVSHSSYVFKGTLRENMLMGAPKASDEQIWALLEEVNLASFVRENGGLDMALLSRGTNLSGGQIQRLALARALLHDADVYIFDEATSNIDVESEEVILRYIEKLKQQKTIIMISHRLANARLADEIYVLAQGNVVEQGSHASLMAAKGVYEEMFTQQQALEQIRTEANNA